MPRKPRVKTVRRTLADGTVKEYRYETSRKDEPDDHDTWGFIVGQYHSSPEWRALAPSSRRAYEETLVKLGPPLAHRKISDIKRRDVMDMRDHYIDHPALANRIVSVMGAVFRYALDREYVDTSPVHKIRRLKVGEYPAWTDEEISLSMERLPAIYRRALMLGLYTGQRISDVVRMRWSDWDGQGVQVRQQKTGLTLWIPAHPDLIAELEQWRPWASAVTILTGASGRPWSAKNASRVFSKACRDIGLRKVTFHGLRKVAAARLAEAGCSDREIMAITGHTSASMVSHYTRSADQKRRATAAVIKLSGHTRENGVGKRPGKH